MKKLFLAASALAIVASPVAAETVGNAAVQRDFVDSCTTCVFVIDQAFGASGQALTSYNLFANRIGTLTPLLLSRSNSGTSATFTITGIGTQASATTGLNTFGFGTTQGTNITGANSYFGFAYNNGGVVGFDYFEGGRNTGVFAFSGPSGYAPALNGQFTADFSVAVDNRYDGLVSRVYSINATATPAVPEPASWAMMIVGFGVVGGVMRRRAKVRTTLTYA